MGYFYFCEECLARQATAKASSTLKRRRKKLPDA
jgi:hypothetical protein